MRAITVAHSATTAFAANAPTIMEPSAGPVSPQPTFELIKLFVGVGSLAISPTAHSKTTSATPAALLTSTSNSTKAKPPPAYTTGPATMLTLTFARPTSVISAIDTA